LTEILVEKPTEYRLFIGRDLKVPKPQAPLAIIYDPKVAYLAKKLAKDTRPQVMEAVPGGEESKRLTVYERLLRLLAEEGLPRDAEVWAVGGGTITDLAGFVAASYLRGVAWRAWPTTTLAMVDAAIGGKTGVNIPEGKNLVGAFHPPRGVYADLAALSTLAPERFREGLVEAFKHGLIGGDWRLLEPWELHPQSADLEPYLARAAAVKANVVSGDYQEKGERMKLNLGHTLGHALEAASKHGLSHGHAVAYGMLFAALLGRRRGGADLTEHVLTLLRWTEAPHPPPASWHELAAYVGRDKKKRSDGLRWVVPYALGDLRLEEVADGELESAFAEWRKLAAEYAG